MNNLKETIELMSSNDYKDRFRAEYWQTRIRYDKLYNMVIKYEGGTLDFVPTCDISVYVKQLRHMKKYLDILVRRAILEDITL